MYCIKNYSSSHVLSFPSLSLELPWIQGQINWVLPREPAKITCRHGISASYSGLPVNTYGEIVWLKSYGKPNEQITSSVSAPNAFLESVQKCEMPGSIWLSQSSFPAASILKRRACSWWVNRHHAGHAAVSARSDPCVKRL